MCTVSPIMYARTLAQACSYDVLHSSIWHITYGNAAKCNNVGKDVGSEGFSARPATPLGKEVDEGEDLVLTNTLWRRDIQCQLHSTSLHGR